MTLVRMTQMGLVRMLQIEPAIAVDKKYYMYLLYPLFWNTLFEYS